MILVEGLELRNYKALKHVELRALRDLNIFVGPNNCGKTGILTALNLLSELKAGYLFECKACQELAHQVPINGVGLSVPYTDKYMHRHKAAEQMEICFSFNEQAIEKLVPRALASVRNAMSTASPEHCVDELRMKGEETSLITEHISPFAHRDIVVELNRLALFCPEQRLQGYKQKDIQEYIRDKSLPGASLRRWEEFLRKVVDPKVKDHAYNLDLIKNLEGSDFQTSLDEQGSGVRSLACLAADLISEERAKVVLIDEPELGLNPFSKQELLKLLLEESETKQIFLATHDPTFVNPRLWTSQDVAIFFYSPFKGEFVKVNLEESREVPETFAGYLPHTLSLRDIHIYVEGTSDVYILQVLLRKYCKQNFQNWPEMVNRVGMFHLAGDFWCHLLYTVPKPPYRCLIILDGDKKQDAKKVCQKYDQAVENVSKFELVEDIEDLADIMAKSDKHPIYCLKQKGIEEYLEHKFDYEQKGYSKTIDGPRIAEEMRQIPEEIRSIFDAILKAS